MIEYGNYKGVEDYMKGYRAKEKELSAEDEDSIEEFIAKVNALLELTSPQTD